MFIQLSCPILIFPILEKTFFITCLFFRPQGPATSPTLDNPACPGMASLLDLLSLYGSTYVTLSWLSGLFLNVWMDHPDYVSCAGPSSDIHPASLLSFPLMPYTHCVSQAATCLGFIPCLLCLDTFYPPNHPRIMSSPGRSFSWWNRQGPPLLPPAFALQSTPLAPRHILPRSLYTSYVCSYEKASYSVVISCVYTSY